MSFFFNRNNQDDRPSLRGTSFMITESGRAKLQSSFDGSPDCNILMALESIQSGNLDDIHHAGNISRGRLERILPKLVRMGYIQANTAGSGGDI